MNLQPEENLTSNNFLLYAAKHYKNIPYSSDTEFLEDLKHIIYIKRLINRYIHKNVLKERLILNHIITLYNLFGPKATSKMLFLKLEGMEKYFIPFLHILNILPEYVQINGKYISTDYYLMDLNILQKLKKQMN